MKRRCELGTKIKPYSPTDGTLHNELLICNRVAGVPKQSLLPFSLFASLVSLLIKDIMARKKKSQNSLAAKGEDEGQDSVPASSSRQSPLPKQSRSQGSSSPSPPSPSPPLSSNSKGTKAKNTEPSTSALIICRNKYVIA